MEVILLERIAGLGQMGDIVKVRNGYGRNYLLPKHKALRANEQNRKLFEQRRAQLETRNLELKKEADAVSAKMKDFVVIAVRQAGELGQLYGSVSTRDIAQLLTDNGFSVARTQVELRSTIKTVGLHPVLVRLHPEVEVNIVVNVARSEEEAVRQARGENVLARERDSSDIPAADKVEEEEEEGVVVSKPKKGNHETDATPKAASSEEQKAE